MKEPFTHRVAADGHQSEPCPGRRETQALKDLKHYVSQVDKPPGKEMSHQKM